MRLKIHRARAVFILRLTWHGPSYTGCSDYATNIVIFSINFVD